MDFVAIDFETANNDRSSVCSVGLVKFHNGKMVDEVYKLIKPSNPYFDPYNTFIHGITYKDVKDEPEFNIVWKELEKYFVDNLILAHNASFDMSVLRHVLDDYSIEYPSTIYNCTRNIAKKTWSGMPSYKLTSVCNHINYQFKHHHALEDAKASATIFLKASEKLEVNDYDDMVDKLSIVTGKIFPGGYRPARINKKHRNRKNFDPNSLIANTDTFDETHPFFGATIVFTGTLQSMVRKEAMQNVVNLGGKCGKSVTPDTNFLVMGDQDYLRFADGKKSSKLKKAEDLITKGQDLEILPENDFLEII